MLDCRGLVAVAAVCAAVAFVMVVVLVCRMWRERKRLDSLGMAVKLTPSSARGLEDALQRRAEALKMFYGQMYYSCDNFPKYAGKLSGYFQENYHNGGIGDFAADIVYAVDVARQGAFSRMALQYGLTDLELRTCCFIHLGFSWQQTCAAELLTENAYSVRCSRIRKKFGLGKEEKIPDFIAKYCDQYPDASRK